jgi:hypothetical protein
VRLKSQWRRGLRDGLSRYAFGLSMCFSRDREVRRSIGEEVARVIMYVRRI